MIVCPLTTTHRGLSLHVEVEATSDTGLDDTSYIQCELLRCVSCHRLVHRLGAIDASTSRAVAAIISTLLSH